MRGRWMVLFVAAAGAAVLFGGCTSKNGMRDRLRVVEAEAVDSRHRAMTAEQQNKSNMLRYDQLNAEAQAGRAQLTSKQNQVEQMSRQLGQAQQYEAAYGQAQQNQARQLQNVRGLTERVSNLQNVMDSLRAEAESARQKTVEREREVVTSEHVEAFRRDLEARLRAHKVNLPVETRTTQSGERQVAIVLRGAFPSGKHSIAHNMDAVKAIVWLGELIAQEYPGSQIRLEGHTDSDKIKSSPYASNHELGQKRAGSVRDLLVKAGVQSCSIETIGHGPDFPLEHGNSARAKKVNRRVEIYILPRE